MLLTVQPSYYMKPIDIHDVEVSHAMSLNVDQVQSFKGFIFCNK